MNGMPDFKNNSWLQASKWQSQDKVTSREHLPKYFLFIVPPTQLFYLTEWIQPNSQQPHTMSILRS